MTVVVDASVVVAALIDTGPVGVWAEALLAPRVWKLRSNITAYDAWYVALAESLGAALATLDARLSRATGTRCEFALPLV